MDHGLTPVSEEGVATLLVSALRSAPAKSTAFFPSRLLVKLTPALFVTATNAPPSVPPFAHCAIAAPSFAVSDSADRSTSSSPADRSSCVSPVHAHSNETTTDTLIFMRVLLDDMSLIGSCHPLQQIETAPPLIE